jgi:hypothetical protein
LVQFGDALVSGPASLTGVTKSKFNPLECGTLEEAVEVSATHPMAKHGSLELRAIAA